MQKKNILEESRQWCQSIISLATNLFFVLDVR